MFISTAYAQVSEYAATQVKSAENNHIDRVFPPFDFSFFESHVFWLLLCFGLFYFFMSRIVLPRIGNVIEARRDRIAADLDHAARMKQEADATIIAYEKELVEARKRAGIITRTASDKARAQAKAEHNHAQTDLDSKLAEAEKRISDIRDKAMQNVGAIAKIAAESIVHKLIDRHVNESSIAKAIKAAWN
ncbi:MAG: ATP synthase subunit B' [Candidatus Tokpelaia sp. JSC189]|nr:MAG: ATP synthase subunit B' [Candidatus Tokpelaia sp. JSC189]